MLGNDILKLPSEILTEEITAFKKKYNKEPSTLFLSLSFLKEIKFEVYFFSLGNKNLKDFFNQFPALKIRILYNFNDEKFKLL